MKQIQILLVLFLAITLTVRGKYERHKRTLYIINNWRSAILPKKFPGAQVLGPTVMKPDAHSTNAHSTNQLPQSTTKLHDSQYPVYKFQKYNGIHITPRTSKELKPFINQWLSLRQNVEHSGVLSLFTPFIAGGKNTPKTSIILLKNPDEKPHIPTSFRFATSEKQRGVFSSNIFRPIGIRLSDSKYQTTTPPNTFYNIMDKNEQNLQIKEIIPLKILTELPPVPESVFQVANNINSYNHDKAASKLKTIQYVSVPLKQVREIERNTDNDEDENFNEEDNSKLSENEQLKVIVNIEGNEVNTTKHPRYTVNRNTISRRSHSPRELFQKVAK